MSAPLAEALRNRFHKVIEKGSGERAVVLRLKVPPAMRARWKLSIRRTGPARAASPGSPKRKGKQDPHRGFFAEIIGQKGDITMPDLASALFEATGIDRADPAKPGSATI